MATSANNLTPMPGSNPNPGVAKQMPEPNNATPNTTGVTPSASKNSILQELCSRPKNYASNPNPPPPPPPIPDGDNSGSSGDVNMTSSLSAGFDAQAPGSPGIKMKIKRSNSTNSSNGCNSKEGSTTGSTSGSTGSSGSSGSMDHSGTTESAVNNSKKSKKRKDVTSSSSTSSSRSSSPR